MFRRCLGSHLDSYPHQMGTRNKPSTHSLSSLRMSLILSLVQPKLKFVEFSMSCQKLPEPRNTVCVDILTNGNIPATISRSLFVLIKLEVRAILIGNFSLAGLRHSMNPDFNRIYSVRCKDREPGFLPMSFQKPLNRGGEPYFCPYGWRRFAVDVGMSGEEFENAFKDWHVAYHGTDSGLAQAILSNGLRSSGGLCFLEPGERSCIH